MKPALAKCTDNPSNSNKNKTRNKSARTKKEPYEEGNFDLDLIDGFLMEIVKIISSLNYPN